MFSVYCAVSDRLFNNLVILRQPWTHAEALLQPVPFSSWLPLLALAACCCFVPLSVVAFSVALGSGTVTKAIWCMVAGGAGLAMALQAAALLHRLKATPGNDHARQQQPQSGAEHEGHSARWARAAGGLSIAGQGTQQQRQQNQSRQEGQRRVPRETLAGRRQHNVQCQSLDPPTGILGSGTGSSYVGSWGGSRLALNNEGRSQPVMESAAAMEGPSLPSPLRHSSSSARPSCATPSASSSAVALTEALRLVQEHRLMSYSCAAQSAHVQLHVAGVQPGELSPGWRKELERQFAGQGWCLLSTAVRRSTCISVTLASLQGDHHTAAHADAGAEVAAEQAADGAIVWEAGTGALPAARVGLTEPSLLATPEELLAGLKISRQEIGPGFSFTVQVITDDGRRHRARYVCQADGSWLKEPLGDGGSRPAALAPGVMAKGTAGAAMAAKAPQLPPCSQQHAQDLHRHGIDDLGGPINSKQRSPTAPGASNAPGSSNSSGDAGAVGTDVVTQADLGFDARGASKEWVIWTPYVVLGTLELGNTIGAAASTCDGDGSGGGLIASSFRAQRYDTHVRADAVTSSSPLHGSAGAGAVEPGACGDCGNEVTTGDPWGDCDVVFRAQSLGVPCKELKVCQVLTHQSVAGAMTRWSQEPEFRMESGSGPGSYKRGNAAGGRSRIWALTVWDESVPAEAGPTTVALPQQQGPGRIGGGDRHAGAAPPFLVDLTAWHGQELLMARIVLLVPQTQPSVCSAVGGGHGCDGGDGDVTSGRRWTRQLEELLSLQPPNVAQHITVDLGLFLSDALEGIPRAERLSVPSAPAPEAKGKAHVGLAPAAAAAAAAASSVEAGCGAHTASVIAVAATAVHGGGGSRVGCQLVLLLDLGTGLLSLVLRHGCCTLAELIWASLERLGFGAEEVLLHCAGYSQGSWPLLHAAAASGEPRVADLVLSWYAAASLPEPWLQPMRIPGSPAVLTPLALAVATSPSGALLSYILRNHPQALVAWRVRMNGASGRSMAVAAGLWAVVLEADVRTAVAPAATALAAALLGSFQATCPMAAAAAAAAAAASSPIAAWSWLHASRLAGRCVAGRLWWTVLEAVLAAVMASPLGLRWHWLCCAAAAAMRCIYQGGEGSLLPPSEMSAYGPQMTLAYVLFVLVTSCCYQAPCGLNVFLRLAEAVTGSRLLYKYGATSRRQRAVVQAIWMQALGWAVGAVLRSRARVVLRRQQQLHQHMQQLQQKDSQSSQQEQQERNNVGTAPKTEDRY
ncbi:hypothetical protein VOLCADRAFT_120165 [Volvox carteri f. nagariensis]|uniref:Uncharacterized protein n=1 Tax=Volvox carteri f. nagariensis TaxID=3068 RepID=D8THD9_VOLCA|nr:uncharacterized protein VOLCADRAFT_120165 [Volvox carteri f. nagariensis]EFJ52694.1 hypothetical protein VOLCADRAFT_120165 [Volvox carteri f. nagariensis]|eukprot:XP_002945699.1 hypothetical protein VOLCADRAFT_120165 [Volvox carteri f. nagariensis]